jgi:hypothetical protein
MLPRAVEVAIGENHEPVRDWALESYSALTLHAACQYEYRPARHL